MAYYITDDCISCGACDPECPNSAIKEGDTIFTINPDRCTECVGVHVSSRCSEVCPVDACHPDPCHRETKEQLLEKWRKLHPGKKSEDLPQVKELDLNTVKALRAGKGYMVVDARIMLS